MKDVILIFDIGKTNKKMLLFDQSLKLVFQHEEVLKTIVDEDGFECDDIDKIESWIKQTLAELVAQGSYNVKAVNFSTYGATLMYISSDGKRLTPAYNYLKPMPHGILDAFYARYGGVMEFSRKTASPALGMLNSGLQALWLKRTKPAVFASVQTVLHLPQYLSQQLTRQAFSEYTSIGCHTALWDFDSMNYHPWCADEKIPLPQPVANDTIVDIEVEGKTIPCGIGIHDSSASLAPYLLNAKDKFVLLSTGTWCIAMNPFNYEPLTMEQLNADCLSYMSVNRKPVKSSRLFMGHIHDVNVKRLTAHFGVADDAFKKISCSESVAGMLHKKYNGKPLFFSNGIPSSFVDESVDLSVFASFEEAYHKFIMDMTLKGAEALNLVLTADDDCKDIFISGGFARNAIYVRYLAALYPDKNIYTSEIDNATALGAAMVVWKAMNLPLPQLDLGLVRWSSLI
jgi:sugar (pentulose or hexulose) kinase